MLVLQNLFPVKWTKSLLASPLVRCNLVGEWDPFLPETVGGPPPWISQACAVHWRSTRNLAASIMTHIYTVAIFHQHLTLTVTLTLTLTPVLTITLADGWKIGWNRSSYLSMWVERTNLMCSKNY